MVLRELVTLLGFKVDDKGLKDADRRASAVLNSLQKRLAALFGGYLSASFVKDSVMAAARVETLDVVLERMGRNVGKTSTELSGLVSQLQETGIAGIEAREVLLRMMQAGLDLNFATPLARLAQDAAVVGGTNSSQALEAIIHGIVTRQPEVLRTYGIQVDFERAFSGKAGKGLSQQQKVATALNLVMKQGEAIAGAYTAAMGTAGKKLGSLTRLQDDFKASFGKLFLGTFGNIIDELSKFFSWFRKAIDKDANGHFATLGKTMHVIYTVLKFLLVPVMYALYYIFMGLMTILKPLVDNTQLLASFGAALAVAFAVAKWTAIVAVFTKLLTVIRAIAIFSMAAAWPLTLITAGVIALALVIEDIYAWVNGQESLVGRILGPWEKVRAFFTDLGAIIRRLPILGTVMRMKDLYDKSANFHSPSKLGGQSSSRSINVNSSIAVNVPDGTPEAQKVALRDMARRAVSEEWDAITRKVLINNPVLE